MESRSATRSLTADYAYGNSRPVPISSSALENRDNDDGSLRYQQILPEKSSTSNLDADVMHTVVSSSKDALGLLFKAAEQQDTDDSDEPQNGPVNICDGSVSVQTPGGVPPTLPPSLLSTPSREILNLWR
jgi:hypothetical protein